MKTVELEPSLVEDIKALLADEEMSERLHKYVSRMKEKLTKRHEETPAQEEKLTPYTMEEINQRLDEAEAEIAAGLGISSGEINRELAEYRANLWK